MDNIIQSAISKVKSLAQKSVNMLPPVQAYNAVKTMATPQFRQQAQSVADWGSNLSQQGANFGQQIGQRIQQTPQFKINPIQDFKTSLTKKVAPTALGMVGSAPGEFVRGIAQLTRDVSEPSRIAQARFGTAKDIFNYNPQDPTKLGIAFNAVTALPDITDLGKVALMGGLATSVLKPQLEAKALKQFLPEIRNVSKMLGNMDEIPDLTPQQVKAAEEIVAKIRGSNAVAQINKLNPNAKDYFNSLRVLLSGAEDQILNPQMNIGFTTKAVNTPRAAQAGLYDEASKYKDADDFFLNSRKGRELLSEQGIKSQEAIKNWFNKNVTTKPQVLDNLNPTGGVLVDYNPQSRMTMPLGKNITTLDKTMKVSPDEMITVYRGAPSSQKRINPGDFITTNPELAKSYSGEGNVISMRVKARDVLDDITEPLGEEYIYRPNVAQQPLYDVNTKASEHSDSLGQVIKDFSHPFDSIKEKLDALAGGRGKPGFSFENFKKLYNPTEEQFKYAKTYNVELPTQKEAWNMVNKSSVSQPLSVPSTKGIESGLNNIEKQISDKLESGFKQKYGNLRSVVPEGDNFLATTESGSVIRFDKKGNYEFLVGKDKYIQDYVKNVTKGVESMPKTSKLSNKLVEDINKGVEEASNKLKERGFVTSVKETPNVTGKVKVKVKGMYEPKPNAELMGEAQALLQEGATIDFKNVEGVDKKVAATIQEALNAQKAGNHQLAANLFNNLSEQGTELGRGVQAFSLLPKMSPEAISLSVAGKIKKYNQTAWKKIPELTGEQQKIIADQLTALDLLKGREKNIALNELQNTLNSFIPSSLVDKGIAVWKAGLLTSLRTHERNFLGNLIHGGLEIAKDIPASIADIGLSKVTGQRTKAFTTRGVREFATKNTGQQIKDIISKGYDPSETINKFDYKTITWGNNPVEQALKKYTDTVFRTLGASDKPFYNAALSRSLYDQATTAAINAGRRGDKVFIEKLVKTPTEEMMKIAMGDANVATFKNKNAATAISSAIKNAMKSEKFGPIGSEIGKLVGEITMPFTGVPSSILGQIINYSPAGLLKGIINTGRVALTDVPNLQRQAVEELGRGIIGTGIFGLGAYLASKGLITGQPKDATEQRLWDTQNKPRNSIFLGGKWRSLNSIGPEAVVFLAGAKLNEEQNNPEGSVANYAMSLGKDYLDQSFVQGVKAPINALTDPSRYAKSYAGQTISSVIPNIVKDAGKAFDPYMREANTVMDYAKSSTPILRNTMLPARDVLGRPRTQEPTGIGAFIDVFNSKTPVNNDVVNELERLYQTGNNATPGKIGKSQTIGGVKKDLTPAELDQLESTVGAEGQAQLKSLINNSGYQKLSDEDKATAIGSLLTGIRKKVRGTIDLSQGVENTGVSTVTASDTPNKTYLLVNSETGTVKQVDLDSEIIYPEMTGIDLVDKKLISEYKSDINSKLSDAIKLQKDGQISLDKLREIAGETAKKLAKTKSAKKIKIKVAPLKFGKRKKITGLSSSKRFKLVRAKRIK